MKSILLFLSAFLLITSCSTKKEQNASLLTFIPDNTAIIIKINDLNSFSQEIEGNEILTKLKTTDLMKRISSRLNPLKFINGESAGLLSISQGVSNEFDFTYISSDTIPLIKLDSVQNKSKEVFTYKEYEVQKFQIEEDEFYTTTFTNKQLLSSSQTILENIISDSDEKKLNPTLEKLYEVSNSAKLGHLWLNLNASDALLKNLLETNEAIKVSNYADWVSLDIDLGEEGIYLDGITIATDSANNFLRLFSKTKPLSTITTQLAPEAVDSYKSYTFNDYKAFAKNQMEYLNTDVALDSLLNTVEEIGIAKDGSQPVVFLKTFGTANITDYLKNIQTNSFEFQGGEIMELGQTSFLNNCLNPLITNFTARYSSILGDTFIFSEDAQTLENIIVQYKSGNILEKTTLYKNAEELTTQESTIFSLANADGFQENLKDDGLEEIAKEIGQLNFSDYLFGSQQIAETNFFHTSYFVKKNSKTTTSTGVTTLYDVQLDAHIALNPQFVTNHRTNRKEIVVQDVDNVLYLISTKGKVLWKKQLEGAIQGKIHQVDIYKNGKLQLAFTTNNQFLIIDRNGKEVAPFTKSYEGGNLNPLAVFDYEAKKDYRFVVTQNKKVFMYNNQGAIVSGFKYTNAEDIILNAPQHFRVGNKDYLVFQLSNGTLKILNRVGNVRVKVSEKIDFSENDVKLNRNKFTLTTSKGLLYQIDTKGSIQKTNLNLNSDHGMDATSKTLATMNDNILSIRDKKVALDLGVYSKPKIFYLNDKIYVSVTDIQSQKSYLFDSQTEPIPDFPVYGTSVPDMSDMNMNKKPELVIKNQDNSITVYEIH
jgi:hypothetical protein